MMSLNAVTFYRVDRESVTALAVFRLIAGQITVEPLIPGDTSADEWLEGTWDPDSEEMVTPDMGERYLQALVVRPMTYYHFEPGEPDPSFGWHSVDVD